MSFEGGRGGSILIAVALGAAMASAPGCSKGERLVQGECRPLNGASVCAWHTMSGDQVVAFGATIPLKAVEAAPADMPMAWPPKVDAVIRMDSMVKSTIGFDNITIYWEPHGHPPGPYLTPHFDFHFNTMDVSRIDCADSTKPASAPVGYELPDVAIPQMKVTLVGLCVPGMGMHALLTSELRSTGLFQKTMLVGYYHKRPIFLEPMVTKATMMERKTFTLEIPAVAGTGAARYPTKFSAYYDSTALAYKFTLSGFAGATK
jgi:hypothetical protein